MRLTRWGECLRHTPEFGLGVPHEANFLAQHYSGVSDKALIHGMPADVEEVERVMTVLKKYRPEYYAALEQYYLRNSGVLLGSRCLRVSEKTFKLYRSCGETYVAGHLHAAL